MFIMMCWQRRRRVLHPPRDSAIPARHGGQRVGVFGRSIELCELRGAGIAGIVDWWRLRGVAVAAVVWGGLEWRRRGRVTVFGVVAASAAARRRTAGVEAGADAATAFEAAAAAAYEAKYYG